MMIVIAAVADYSRGEEDHSQHHEHQCLDETNKEFQAVEGHRHQEGNQKGHDRQQHLAGEDIAKETKGETNDLGKLTAEVDRGCEHFL